MALTTLAQLRAAKRQRQRYFRGTINLFAPPSGDGCSTWAPPAGGAFEPPLGTLAVGNTTSGVVFDNTTVGALRIDPFGAGNTGRIVGVKYWNVPASGAANRNATVTLFDRLWGAGAFSWSTLTTFTLTGQPALPARLPNGYEDVQLWVELVATVAGTGHIIVTYTNENGVTGRSTGDVSLFTAANRGGHLYRLPLQAGDKGVQKVETVQVTTTNGVQTLNVLLLRTVAMVCRPQLELRTLHAFGPDALGLPVVYDTSCLFTAVTIDAGWAAITHSLLIDIASG